MQIDKVKKLIAESQEFLQKDVDKMIESILLSDDLNCNYGDQKIVIESLVLGVKVYEAMCKGIGEKEAFSLLEQYDEAQNKVRMMEKEYWVKAGIRIGCAFCGIGLNAIK